MAAVTAVAGVVEVVTAAVEAAAAVGAAMAAVVAVVEVAAVVAGVVRRRGRRSWRWRRLWRRRGWWWPSEKAISEQSALHFQHLAGAFIRCDFAFREERQVASPFARQIRSISARGLPPRSMEPASCPSPWPNQPTFR